MNGFAAGGYVRAVPLVGDHGGIDCVIPKTDLVQRLLDQATVIHLQPDDVLLIGNVGRAAEADVQRVINELDAVLPNKVLMLDEGITLTIDTDLGASQDPPRQFGTELAVQRRGTEGATDAPQNRPGMQEVPRIPHQLVGPLAVRPRPRQSLPQLPGSPMSTPTTKAIRGRLKQRKAPAKHLDSWAQFLTGLDWKVINPLTQMSVNTGTHPALAAGITARTTQDDAIRGLLVAHLEAKASDK